jgi:hypothetical protein
VTPQHGAVPPFAETQETVTAIKLVDPSPQSLSNLFAVGSHGKQLERIVQVTNARNAHSAERDIAHCVFRGQKMVDAHDVV